MGVLHSLAVRACLGGMVGAGGVGVVVLLVQQGGFQGELVLVGLQVLGREGHCLVLLETTLSEHDHFRREILLAHLPTAFRLFL